MFKQCRLSARATGFSVIALLSGCGGGGDAGGSSPPPPPSAPNRPPSLSATAISTNEDVAASAQLAATDPDGNPVTFSLTTDPQHGAATLTATGALSFVPAPNYSGTDTIGVTVSDNIGASATATVEVTVNAVDDAPVLTTTQLSVNEDAVVSTQLAGTDVENDAFTFQLLPGAAHGNVTLSVSGELSYAPNADYSGTDQIRVRLAQTASGLAIAEQSVNVTVLPINDVPTANDDTLRVAATPGQSVALPALTNDTDVDGDALMPAVITQPRGGTVTVNATTRQMTFEPANGYLGPIEFTYRVNDGAVNSNIATVRGVIGDFETLVFLSDYTTPGVAEVHTFDGLDVRRVSDALPPGSTIINYNLSGDLRTLVYIVDHNDALRVYAKPLDGSAAATLRYTALKSVPPPAYPYVGAYVNANGSFMTVLDTWSSTAKQWHMVDLSTGAVTQIGGLMPGLVDVRFAIFHPFEPDLLMVQGQIAGNVPRDNTAAMTAFLGNAASMGTLTQIGRTYSSGELGAGEGFYFGRDPRYIYYGEQVHVGTSFPFSLLAYDRDTSVESPVVRFVVPPDLGMSNTGWWSPDSSRLCFPFNEPTSTTQSGPSRYYVLDMGNPASAVAVTPAINDVSQCTFASDNRTMIFRVFTPGRVSQQAFAVDSVNPAAPRLLAPPSEASSEQGQWMFAHDAMLGTIAYYQNDGDPGTLGAGRNYLLPLDGNGSPFLFTDNYVPPGVTSSFYDLNSNGSFLIHGRTTGATASLEIMSTHALNYSIPLSRNGQTVGVLRASWLQRYP